MRTFLNLAGVVPHKFISVEEVREKRAAVIELSKKMVYTDGLRVSKRFKTVGDKLSVDQTGKTQVLMTFLRVCASECETAIFTKKNTINVCKKKGITKHRSLIEYRLLT